MDFDRYGNCKWDQVQKKHVYIQPSLDDILKWLASGSLLWKYSYQDFYTLSTGTLHKRIEEETLKPAWDNGALVENFRRPSSKNSPPKGEKIYYKIKDQICSVTYDEMNLEYTPSQPFTLDEVIEYMGKTGFIRVYMSRSPKVSIHSGRPVSHFQGRKNWFRWKWDLLTDNILSNVFQLTSEGYYTKKGIEVRIYRLTEKTTKLQIWDESVNLDEEMLKRLKNDRLESTTRL